MLKKSLFFFIFLFDVLFSQSIVNIQYNSTTTFGGGPTPQTPGSYVWTEYTNIEQGLNVNIVVDPTQDIFLQLNNSKINLTGQGLKIFASISVKFNGGSWSETLSSASTESGWISVPISSVGKHTMEVKWMEVGSIHYISRTYDVYITNQSNKLFKDSFNNTITCWGNGNGTPIIISEGFDPYNISNAEFLMYKGDDLFNELLLHGFDIYILNFNINGQDMRNLASIYNSASNYLSNLTNNNNMVACGISMGGVIVKYALAKAEQDGNALPFCRYISIDSPHQGANINEDLQGKIKDKGSNFDKFNLNNTAAHQMLQNNTFGSLYNDFYNELNALNNSLGYPQLTENIGVSFSNGSPNSSLPNPWLRMRIYHLWVITDEYFIQRIGGDDDVSGSLLPTSSVPDNVLSFMAAIPSALGYVQFERYGDPTFIPYFSSADIVNGTSKFDVHITANSNCYHDEFPQEVVTDLLTLLTVTTSGELVYNENWEDNVSLAGNVSIPAGITLRIKNGISLDLNNYTITSTGGSIIIDSDVNLDALIINKSNGTTIGIYPPNYSLQALLNSAGTNQTLLLQSKTYNSNLSIMNKPNFTIKGVNTGQTTINGNITITNSSYTNISDLNINSFKTITVNGGTRPSIRNISYSGSYPSYIKVYDGVTTETSNI
ncbi:MAG: hypothetical protein JEY94_19225 [Melioribacteraceae bacterium]|nr:hypothetical protein [Melioribacteraceae bacterium]